MKLSLAVQYSSYVWGFARIIVNFVDKIKRLIPIRSCVNHWSKFVYTIFNGNPSTNFSYYKHIYIDIGDIGK
jgi:hypothetical protein